MECPLCSRGEGSPYRELPDRFQPDGELYHLYRCGNCGFIFLYPRPAENEMSRFYPGADYDPFLETGQTVSLIQRIYALVKPRALAGKAKLVGKYFTRPGNLLDVGAGAGGFLQIMRRKGWQVTGVEKDDRAAEYGRKRSGLTIFTDDLCDAGEFASQFEAVTFWHSLEHIHRLKENIARVKQLIKPGGILIIALPNPGAWETAVYGNYWAAYDAPRHLWHFTPKVLKNWFKQEGWEHLQSKALPFDPFYICLLSEKMIFGRGKLLRILFRLPAAAICSFCVGMFKTDKASSVVYVFRRSMVDG